MDVIKQVFVKVKAEYVRTITKKLMMIDAFILYSLLTALVQVFSFHVIKQTYYTH